MVSPLILNFVAECDGALYINARMDKKLYIYKPDSISPIAIVPITKSAVHKCTLMTEEYVEVHFEHSVIAEFKKGFNIYIDHRCFKLRADSYPERLLGKNGYKYVLKFYAPQHDMEDCRVKWLASSMKEITFDLTTTLASFAQLFCDNMNDFLGVTTWKVGSLPTEDADATQHISFDGSTVWDKVDECAKVFGVEWWVEDNDTEVILNFGKLEVGDYEDFVEGDILKAVPATKRGQDADYGTRFYVFGGTQNIPEDYYEAEQGGVTNHISQKRLHLPGGKQYIDAFEDMEQSDIIEQPIILDDIYPKNTETVTGAEVVEREIDGTKSFAYVMICDDTPFDPDTMKVGTLGAVFTSGSLNGREFSLIIKENSFDKRFEIIAQSESAGGNTSIIIPNEHLKPAVGDTFVLTGIELPQERIDEAEEELYNKAMEVVYERSHDTNIYECETNAPYCTKNDKNFAVGQKVRLVGLQFGEKGRYSRIMGFEKKLYDPYQAVYSVGNNSKYSRFKAIVSDINISIGISEAQTSKKVGGLQVQSISNAKGLESANNTLTKVASDRETYKLEHKAVLAERETIDGEFADFLATYQQLYTADDEACFDADGKALYVRGENELWNRYIAAYNAYDNELQATIQSTGVVEPTEAYTASQLEYYTAKVALLKAISTEQKKQISDLDYLKQAFGADNVADSDGVTLSRMMSVKDGKANVVAGMYGGGVEALDRMGYDDPTHGTLMIFAGATSAQTARNSKYRVYEDGTAYIKEGIFEGIIKHRVVDITKTNITSILPPTETTIGGYTRYRMSPMLMSAIMNITNEYVSLNNSYFTASDSITFAMPVLYGFTLYDADSIANTVELRGLVGTRFIVYNNTPALVHFCGKRYNPTDKTFSNTDTCYDDWVIGEGKFATAECKLELDGSNREVIYWDIKVGRHRQIVLPAEEE